MAADAGKALKFPGEASDNRGRTFPPPRRPATDLACQIEAGILVCPHSHLPLDVDKSGNRLLTPDGRYCYRLLDGQVPLLLQDEAWAAQYAGESAQMTREYAPTPDTRVVLKARLRAWAARDHRTQATIRAFQRLLDGLPEDAFCLSVGGGPGRAHPRFVNLNIGPFPNVEVVADAHFLPYADGSVDAIECEAVLEHLSDPARAVAEMFRVLKPGGRVFAATPFMQAYHGYPSHFQNFTVTGHAQLFGARGFQILESGACVGPMNAWITLNAVFLRQYLPRPVGPLLAALWQLASAPLRVLDRRLAPAAQGHVLASSTYLVAQKNLPGMPHNAV